MNELRGLVLAKYPSITAFAEAIGWNRLKASRIVNRIQRPLATEMVVMATLLGVKDDSTFVRVFFPDMHMKGGSDGQERT